MCGLSDVWPNKRDLLSLLLWVVLYVETFNLFNYSIQDVCNPWIGSTWGSLGDRGTEWSDVKCRSSYDPPKWKNGGTISLSLNGVGLSVGKRKGWRWLEFRLFLGLTITITPCLVFDIVVHAFTSLPFSPPFSFLPVYLSSRNGDTLEPSYTSPSL